MIPQEHPEWDEYGRSARWPSGAMIIVSLLVSLVLMFLLIACTTTSAGVPQPPEPYLSRLASMPYLVIERPQAGIDSACRVQPGEGQIGACAIQVRGGSCIVYVLDSLPASTRAATIIHERGHCAGWPADHPQ